MSKLELSGVFSLLGGLVLALFQGISSMMTAGEIEWKGRTLLNTFGEETFAWIDDIGFTSLKNLAVTIVNTQLFIVLLVLGVLLLIAGVIFKRL
jgi:hypothetical protein